MYLYLILILYTEHIYTEERGSPRTLPLAVIMSVPVQ